MTGDPNPGEAPPTGVSAGRSWGPLSGLLDGPRSLFVLWRLLDRRAWALFVSYLLVATGVVTAFALVMLALGPQIKQGILEYIFPEHWRITGKWLLERFFGRLGNQVLANFIVSGSMTVISMTCFSFKELLSRRIEHTNPLLPFGHAVWPLWRQAIEELKYAILYWFAYCVIFWVAYWNTAATSWAARGLSYFVLFTFFDIIFLCPLLLRHRIGYGRMVRTFLARPFAAYGYAGAFLAPSLVASHLLEGQPMSLVIPVLLSIHVLTVAPAASAGTWLAARLLPTAQAMRPSRLPTRLAAWGVVLAVLAWSSLSFAWMADSLHAKTQILKCQYRVDWSSFELDPPSLSDLSVGLGLDIEITNPTEHDVRIEDSRLEVENDHKHFATVQLGRIEVPAGQVRRQRVDLRIEIQIRRLLEYKDLLQKPWGFTLWVRVTEDFEFPVYLR